MLNTPYSHQVNLLLDVLPAIQSETCFALKGGTAINLFIRDMPRLSVDIDLTYLPIEPRETFLNNLDETLNRLTVKLNALGFHTHKTSKLVVSNHQATIKIEPNPIFRGTVFGTETRELCAQAQNTFLQTQSVKMISTADVYGGKICAALDRQHPRDLFDIKQLLENEGLTDSIRQAFLVYLISASRPIHEMLSPNLLDQYATFQQEFIGMTNTPASYEALEQARLSLIHTLQKAITNDEKAFLLSFKKGDPDWALLPIPHIETLPGPQWKLLNIKKMDRKAHSQALQKLEHTLC